MQLSAKQTAQRLILAHWGNWQDIEELKGEISPEMLEQFWDEYGDDECESRNEVRWHGDETSNINTRIHYSWSRNYDVEVRVINLGDGNGLAYNFVSGGGKHGDPDAYPWWDEAWFVKCTGAKTVVTHTYEDIAEQGEQA